MTACLTARMLISKLIGYAAPFPFYLLSLLIPRKKDIWVFGAWFGHRYSDNSRYVFEYVCKNEPSIRAIWITRQRAIVDAIRRDGREAYLADSLKGFWICCRASTVFITCAMTDVNRAAAYRAKKIQLWHGTPLKKIGLDDVISTFPNRSRIYRFFRTISRTIFPYSLEKFDLAIAPSPTASMRFASAFGMSPAQVKVVGYPRGDVILNPKPELVPAVESFRHEWNAKHIVCYIPTHRGMGQDEFDPFRGLDIEKMNDCLERHDAVLFIKMHFCHKDAHLAVESQINHSRIYMLTEDELSDVNLLLPHTDILITDYSSVYFDYLLLDRPIIFAPFDKDYYLSGDRELYEDYNSATPGPKCRNWEELIETLDRVLGGEDGYQEQRRACRDRYNSFVDTENCKRVVELARYLAFPNGVESNRNASLRPRNGS